jgi:acyl-CoA thioesterase-1
MDKRFWLALLLVGCARATPTFTPTPKPPGANLGTVVAFGDSLSAGMGLDEDDAYPAQLQRRLERDGFHCRVVNAGVSGETSSAALARVDWVMKLKPHLVILETGANDGLRGLDPGGTEDNLNAIIGRFKHHQVKVLLAGMQTLDSMGKGYADKFAAVYPRVASIQQIPLIPFFLEGVAGKSVLNEADGLHPNKEGYAKIVERIAPQVENLLR